MLARDKMLVGPSIQHFYQFFLILCFMFCLVQLENLEQETLKWCREILRNSPTAIRVLKSALNAVDDGHAGLQVSLNRRYMIRMKVYFLSKRVKRSARHEE